MDTLLRVMIHLSTSLSRATLYKNLAMSLACTASSFVWKMCLIFSDFTAHSLSYCTSSHILQIVYIVTGWSMPHCYTLIHSIFFENLFLTTRLYVSFYQSTNDGNIIIFIIISFKIYPFCEISVKFSKNTPF